MVFFIPQKNSEKIGKFQKKYVNFRKKWKNCLKKGILFFKPKIFTSRSLKCHEIPPVVLLSTVLLKTILRVHFPKMSTGIYLFRVLAYSSLLLSVLQCYTIKKISHIIMTYKYYLQNSQGNSCLLKQYSYIIDL